jgi:S1-C subfamily serine protease
VRFHRRTRKLPEQHCPNCGEIVKPGARFCWACGEKLTDRQALTETRRRINGGRATVALLVLLALGLAAYATLNQRLALSDERSVRKHEAAALRAALTNNEKSLVTLSAQNAALAARLKALSKGVAKGGFAPLAKRILRSVFTIETSEGFGSGWAAWTEGSFTYLITAKHVVTSEFGADITTVKVRQKNRSWTGSVEKTDSVNDLAVVRVQGLIATPLWQTAQLDISPLVGDELVVVGSPYGLEGTVTTGIVSRVSYDVIQTDAAANPGNSGGPAVDRQGNVVGVVVSGGGENLNFAVPIQRACVTIRKC